MDFRLKATTFFTRPVAIICQNENGPCPLIAIANILTLRGKIEISPDRSFISLEEVIQLVTNEIFESQVTSTNETTEEALAHQQQRFQDVLNVLPRLAQGLDVNIGFKDVNKHEYTEEISIFDSLSISLLHGWLYDPQDSAVASVIGDLSYNHLIYKMVDYRSMMDQLAVSKETESEEEEAKQKREQLLQEGAIITQFMEESASQLTTRGIFRLYEYMNDRQLAVFFRNNHFSTLFAYHGQLFQLVTDLGYLHQPAIIWELLDIENLHGASEFYNEEFIPISQLPYALQDSPVPSPRIPDPSTPISSSANGGGEGTIALPPGVPLMPVPASSHSQTQNSEVNVGGSKTAVSGSAAERKVDTHSSSAVNQENAASLSLDDLLSPQQIVVSNSPSRELAESKGATFDSDYLLALQLQEKEDTLSAQTLSSSHASGAPVPTAGVVAEQPMMLPGEGMTQEQIDRQVALMYYYEEKQQEQASSREAGSTTSQRGQNATQTSSQRSKQQSQSRQPQSQPQAQSSANQGTERSRRTSGQDAQKAQPSQSCSLC
eukprot:gene8386-9244_t